MEGVIKAPFVCCDPGLSLQGLQNPIRSVHRDVGVGISIQADRKEPLFVVFSQGFSTLFNSSFILVLKIVRSSPDLQFRDCEWESVRRCVM